MKRIAQEVQSIKNIEDHNQNMFIESFLYIVAEYNRNEANLTELLQLNIVRIFRIVLGIPGLNTGVYYALFKAI